MIYFYQTRHGRQTQNVVDKTVFRIVCTHPILGLKLNDKNVYFNELKESYRTRDYQMYLKNCIVRKKKENMSLIVLTSVCMAIRGDLPQIAQA